MEDTLESYKEAWVEGAEQLEMLDLDDGLENVLTGMGTSADKSTANQWVHSGRNLEHWQLAARFREDWISQKVCTIVPQDMTREWRDINTEEGK